MSAPVETNTNGIHSEPVATSETAPAAPANTTATRPAIDDKDVSHWKNRVNELISTSGKSEAAVANSKPWHESIFGCFSPIDTCLITWCLPCVTFGKIHHRLHHHGELEGYSPVNTSCLLFCVSSCLAVVPAVLQRGDVRKKYGLQGDFVTDLVLNCCCGCCSLVQIEKETAWQEKELLSGAGAQYANAEKMEYKAAE